MAKKKELFRYEWGSLDVISAAILLIGVYITQLHYDMLGWIIVAVAILKQFSGK